MSSTNKRPSARLFALTVGLATLAACASPGSNQPLLDSDDPLLSATPMEVAPAPEPIAYEVAVEPVHRPAPPVYQTQPRPVKSVARPVAAPQPTAAPQPIANSRPVATADASLKFDAPIARPSTPSVDDIDSLERREDELATRLGNLNLERKVTLRCANAIRRHQADPSGTNQERLDRALDEHSAEKHISASLGRHSTASDFDEAERKVRAEADRVGNERRALVRLIVAKKEFDRDPSNANQARLDRAIEKYRSR